MFTIAPLISQPNVLDAVLEAPALRGTAYSVYVSTLDGRKLYGKNESIRLVPASNEKIFTGAFALNTLGPDYKPITVFRKTGDQLLINSVGDPGMTYDELIKVKSDLHLDGKTRISIQEAYRPGIPPSWEFDDLPNKYAASITAFTVDKGAFEVWTDGASAMFLPAAYGNALVTDSKIGQLRVAFDLFAKRATIAGQLPKTKQRLDTLALPEPDLSAASLLGGSATQIPYQIIQTKPEDYVLTGRPVSDLLKECLSHSDNMLAESLLLMAAGHSTSLTEDPYGVATRQIRDFLVKTVGIDELDIRPYDGSGLSRHNMLTTRALAKVLIWSGQQPTKDLWLDCLAAAGVGTLKDRLHKTTFKGKTGTMDGVVALSGYLKTADGKDIVMSFVVNQALGGAKAVREVQDAFVRALESEKLDEISDSIRAVSERSRD